MKVVKFSEGWAVSREQVLHAEALLTYGEQCVLRQVSTVDDFEAGIVARCGVCQAGEDDGTRDLMAVVFGQSGDSYCQTCLGTGWDPPFAPVIYITWAMIRDETDDWQYGNAGPGGSGRMKSRRTSAQFPWTPHFSEGDLVVRVRRWRDDGVTPEEEAGRYVLQEIAPTSIRTGPGRPTEEIWVGQRGQLANIPPSHALQLVEVAA